MNDVSKRLPVDDDRTLDLVRRAVAGDQEAWHEVVAVHEGLMRSVLRHRMPRSLRARFDAEDVMQSAFLELSQQGENLELRDAPSFRAWLTRVLVNKLRDRIRSAARASNQGVRECRLPTDVIDQQSDGRPSEVDLVEQAELMTRMYERIMSLDPEDREIVTCRLIDKLGWAEIASRTGLAVATVSNRYRELLENIVRGFI